MKPSHSGGAGAQIKISLNSQPDSENLPNYVDIEHGFVPLCYRRGGGGGGCNPPRNALTVNRGQISCSVKNWVVKNELFFANR